MKKHKILIIDDEIETINIIIDFLEEEYPHYIFHNAVDGISGIATAKKHIPDLIITDWEMPGLSGIDTIKELKKNITTSQIPVIMLTGIMTSSKNLRSALKAGAIDYIRKPIDEIELKARISSMLLLANIHKENIDIKNRELAATTMNILQNNEFNIYVIKKLQNIEYEFVPKNKKLLGKLKNLKSEISAKIKREAWTNFDNYFKKAIPNFTNNLLTKFPELSPAEIKLASLLRLKLSSKEIASLIFITPDSVKTSRNRLRKKLNLSSSDNLTSFLLRF